MFEAHFHGISEAPTPCWSEAAREPQRCQHPSTLADSHANTRDNTQTQQSAEQGLNRHIQSLRHQCPLHAWAAPGKRKDASGQVHEQWFLYIEYCTRKGARTWQKRECAQTNCSLDTLFALALQAELPGIDSERTRLWLKMHRGH